ncbi:3D domain-containing protein [Candidatus Uhrbacteria bacterium]|nr:3D domain-containing protein [Candidatus Uhrbacteria bacterium]
MPNMMLRTWRKHPLEAGTLLVLALLAAYVFVPRPANAVLDTGSRLPSGPELELRIAAMQNETLPFGTLPQADNGKARRIFYKVPTTAYNSLPGQTDDTPFITASGTHTRHGVVATNFLRIGTKVAFPDLYPGEVFLVEDRMNPRYHKRVDIWMEELADARNFGIKYVTLEVLE